MHYNAFMPSCPNCQRVTINADMVHMLYIYGASLKLILKINPDWSREDGICSRCLESILDTVAELEDMKAEQRRLQGVDPETKAPAHRHDSCLSQGQPRRQSLREGRF